MDALLQRLKRLGTTSVSDAMDRLGANGGLLGIKPLSPGLEICGPAFTAHYLPCGQVKGTVGNFLDDLQPGQVVVVDNAGREYCSVWGDIASAAAQGRGAEGTVIDGVCRDIGAIKAMNYPVFTKGSFMVTGKDRVELDAVGVPVSVSGVQVRPGDVILGDDTGVIVVPQGLVQQIVELAEKIDETDRRIVDELRRGSSLRDARKKFD
jgi:4-hydroxy-4-methyl-2-oxoglutarate aldolase